MEKVLDVDDFLEWVNKDKKRTSRWAVYKAAKEGQIPSFKIGNRILFRESAVEAYMKGELPT